MLIDEEDGIIARHGRVLARICASRFDDGQSTAYDRAGRRRWRRRRLRRGTSGGHHRRVAHDWLMPHPAVAALVPVLKARGAQHVLVLGCGVGRHALFFAEHGFAVEAIDGAAAGLDFACREAAARGLRLSLRQADADTLPFADESFNHVLS
jgi:SAM-dependent methyltransferase